ncbi:hypothetical protein [Paraburkholderia nemoris]|uniref:hypothetical protein n=1 Tax=Paraburkholderia nemoris TaxID=2793076 RepID=UPI001B150C1B|nr:hypothetical protein [Paraburkholderia nemoris]CAE6839517.1 hypothetical protein R75777_07002 [Paraburkholderia nemoris]
MSYEVWGEPDDGPELPEGWLDEDGAQDLRDEIARLNAIIHTPHADDFWKAVSIEAEFQRQTRGADDGDKSPAAWFWLVGYLGGKALHAHAAGNVEKAEHHIITTAAALANWHRAVFGKTDMRPGIEEQKA